MHKQVKKSLSRVSPTVARLAIASVVGLALMSPLRAGPLEEGLEAVYVHHYAEALRLLRPLAEAGNAVAQFNIGFMYEHGHGVRPSYAEAIHWYRRSSDQGFGEGQFSLGYMYYKGLGVPKDMVAASMWFQLASERLDDDCHKENAVLHFGLASMNMTNVQQEEAVRRAAEWRPLLEPPRTEQPLFTG